MAEMPDGKGYEPMRPDETRAHESESRLNDARVRLGAAAKGAFRTVPARKRAKRDRHARTKVAFFRYSYYDIAFKYFVEHVLDADFVELPAPTKRTLELGAANSNDFVCAPFKHILGDYIEALELGAEVLVQFAGPCRLGYYGELQEAILRDMGYEFEMINFAELTSRPVADYIKLCKKVVNPNLSVANGVRNMFAAVKMLESLDAVEAFYLANAGFEREPGSFARERAAYHAAMRAAECEADIVAAHEAGMAALAALPLDKPERPLRVGLVGEFFTAVDPHSNLGVEEKMLAMGVELHRTINLTVRNFKYDESAWRAKVPEYVTYDMGPTSSLTIAAANGYAEEGFDGVIHLKSAGCTPEVDCMPVLQRISRETGMPMLYLSYDSQTSDTGLDTRLEAFYDMIAWRRTRR